MPVIEVWVLENTDWSQSFCMQAICLRKTRPSNENVWNSKKLLLFCFTLFNSYWVSYKVVGQEKLFSRRLPINEKETVSTNERSYLFCCNLNRIFLNFFPKWKITKTSWYVQQKKRTRKKLRKSFFRSQSILSRKQSFSDSKYSPFSFVWFAFPQKYM